MVPRVKIVGVPRGATASDLKAIIRASPHTRYPVYEGDLDHIVGMIHIKDILRRFLNRQPNQADSPRSVPLVPETMPIDEVLAVMRQSHTQMVVVMDEYGGTAGLITIEDLFEEVIGEIDEGTGKQQEIRQDAKGMLHVAGTVRIAQVGDRLNQVLEHEEVDTVSGLVLASLGRPPRIGDVVIYDHVRFEITVVEGHGVKECIVTTTKNSRQNDSGTAR